MLNHKIKMTFFSIVLTTMLFSCKESDTSALQDAQLCLNKAAQSEALDCVTKIESDVSPLAYSLRCSAIFISQGFGDAADFVNALDSINSGGNCSGGCSSTVNVLYSLNFTAAGTGNSTARDANNAAAEAAFTQCRQADAKIYAQIASLFKLGTLSAMAAYGASGGSPITQDNLEAAIATLTPSDVGAVVTATYGIACTQNIEDQSDSTKQYCAELKAALDSGSTDTDIGNCLINKLQNPSYVCP